MAPDRDFMATRRSPAAAASAKADGVRMRFFLYEIAARVVAFYLCVDCVRKLRRGLAGRKIAYFNPSLLDWSHWIADRDAAPVRYWIQIGIRIVLLIACAFVAIFGWWQPNA